MFVIPALGGIQKMLAIDDLPQLIENLPFVLNLEHSDFDIVSDFGFRYSDFHNACFVPVQLKRY